MAIEDESAQEARAALCNEIISCITAHNILHVSGASLSRRDLSCASLVLSQLNAPDCMNAATGASPELNAARWMLPEPWNGRLGSAALLFIGQNPSADFTEDFPTLGRTSAPDNENLPEYFESRFDGHSIKDGTRVKLKSAGKGDGYSSENPFLKRVLSVAENLYGRKVVPGDDYALTEGVRCKSRNAIGVRLAVDSCAARYMAKTLSLSAARVIVCFGEVARRALLAAYLEESEIDAMAKKLPFGSIASMTAISNSIFDKQQVLFLSHPNARGKYDLLDRNEIKGLRALLANPVAR